MRLIQEEKQDTFSSFSFFFPALSGLFPGVRLTEYLRTLRGAYKQSKSQVISLPGSVTPLQTTLCLVAMFLLLWLVPVLVSAASFPLQTC